ncbi:DUF6502 family protein [Leptothrix discophora]|uniref:DUF6502 family protein n=1 Tax=Leptothrix discophora TaxID=89 RepID=A0ABT9G8B7_LEPDI|nr:DUF6502 family protein [Leptothrix discophora]MDP4302723.1 DUF6502 family protein [Leptothrix discophora]
MEVHTRLQTVLEAAVARLLRPLFRVLLRQSMSFVAFEAIAKRVYVEVAMQDFAIEGKKSSISRASILSGLTRKEVTRLVVEATQPVHREGADVIEGEPPRQRYNRAARVLTGWVRDATFHDAAGNPRPLDPNDTATGFGALVRRHSGDMPVRAMLDELLRVGAVRRTEDGRIALQNAAYVPADGPLDKLDILGQDVADLIATIDHNIQHGADNPRYQRKVMYEAIPAEALPAFRQLGASQAQRLLEQLDRWLADHDTDLPAPGDTQAGPRLRVGLGIYYFEEPAAARTPDPTDPTGASS